MPCDHIFSSPILHIPGNLMASSCRIFCVSTILSLGCLVGSWRKKNGMHLDHYNHTKKKTKTNQCETRNLPCGFTAKMAVTHRCISTKQFPRAAKDTGSDLYECKSKAWFTPTLLMYLSKELYRAAVSYSATLTLPHFFF